jgi:hypothetical protein
MNILPYYLERLKLEVLQQANLQAASPADCKRLAGVIQAKLKVPLSDTTLKRVFGFAAAKHGSSLYTLNVLAQYCGYEGWASFCDGYGSTVKVALPATIPLISVSQWTWQTSRRTLEALINASGIPYPLTVKRNFIDDQLNFFSGGEQRATVLCAPAGYGKTIGLCHWVEERLNLMQSGNHNDMLLFLSSRLLPGLQAGGNSVNDWLTTLIGFGPEHHGLAGQLYDRLQEAGLFYLVIDGFDPEQFKPGEFERLSELLLDVLSLYRTNPNFKLILSMRSASWLALYQRLQAVNGTGAWDLGFMGAAREDNVPLFSPEELQTLRRRIRPGAPAVPVTLEVIALLSYPLFFQYYYHKHTADFRPDKLDRLDLYELVANYFLEKIYRSRLAAEKLQLLHTLLDHVQPCDGNYPVRKLAVLDALKRSGPAYQELLSLGFLRSVNRSREGSYAEYIEFAHKRFLMYTLAGKLVYTHQEHFDEALMEDIGRLPEGCRLSVLKWCAFKAVKAGQYHFFNQLPGLPLPETGKALLIRFLGDLRQHICAGMPAGPSLSFGFSRQPALVSYILGAEYCGEAYGQVLEGWSGLQLEDPGKIWIHTALAMNHLAMFNSAGVEACLAELRRIPQAYYAALPIHPLNCLETIFAYLKYGVLKKEALRQITAYCFNPPTRVAGTPEAQLLFLLALHTLKLGAHPAKQLRLIKVLEQRMSENIHPESGFYFLVRLLKAEAYLEAGQVEKSHRLYLELAADQAERTAYPAIRLRLLKAKLLVNMGSQAEAGQAAEQLAAAADKSGYHSITAEAVSVYLDRYSDHEPTDFLKRIQYQLIRTIRRGGFAPKSFRADSGLSDWSAIAV